MNTSYFTSTSFVQNDEILFCSVITFYQLSKISLVIYTGISESCIVKRVKLNLQF